MVVDASSPAHVPESLASQARARLGGYIQVATQPTTAEKAPQRPHRCSVSWCGQCQNAAAQRPAATRSGRSRSASPHSAAPLHPQQSFPVNQRRKARPGRVCSPRLSAPNAGFQSLLSTTETPMASAPHALAANTSAVSEVRTCTPLLLLDALAQSSDGVATSLLSPRESPCELADAALHKSRLLLKSLSELDLSDPRGDQTPKARFLEGSLSSTPCAAAAPGPELVTPGCVLVPVATLNMIAEMWQQLQPKLSEEIKAPCASVCAIPEQFSDTASTCTPSELAGTGSSTPREAGCSVQLDVPDYVKGAFEDGNKMRSDRGLRMEMVTDLDGKHAELCRAVPARGTRLVVMPQMPRARSVSPSALAPLGVRMMPLAPQRFVSQGMISPRRPQGVMAVATVAQKVCVTTTTTTTYQMLVAQ